MMTRLDNKIPPHSRNPVYLGLLLLLIARMIYLGHIAGLAVMPMLVLYLTRFQIRSEERMLRIKFGDA